MYSSNGGKGFREQAEQWKRENTNPGGGALLKVKGARIDNHSEALKDVREKRNQSEQSGSSMRRS
ncbi:hypothetical protein [Wolbachia endosymbiont of Ctenocephalides felis wCfeJ]|uniref:hypothetical protein n=1 Tax=Wolbachia endosymbiont of Ctenocephalides felis wCfeJ TaxID=2732594 RepID=UPI0014480D5A|nr:hypothetical protein [Wolbachia endosymbiont of Ctenocephalides felis wCfeJ]WCR58533.1 MAG: hypothetical protein PG980_001005 [Wolbachia endosymbiont of Ctenocephalides felis wCfeJ]